LNTDIGDPIKKESEGRRDFNRRKDSRGELE
jgi:hypothetical protein